MSGVITRGVTIRGILAGHTRLFICIATGLLSLVALPGHWPGLDRAIAAWDIGSTLYLVLLAWLFLSSPVSRMPANAEAQQDGEWVLFFLVLAGVTISFVAILGEFGSMKDATAVLKDRKVLVVAGTLAVSWLLTQAVFALRYAHEFYTRTDGAAVDGGLDFPKEDRPDYWDFLYFAIVLGMTFQVSDVQITSRKLRRLATLHGLLGFLFNTVIIALTVNLASSVL